MSLASRSGTPRDTAPAFDKTLSPDAFSGALDAVGMGIAVLSSDADFVESVWDVSHAHPSIVVVDAWPALLEAVDKGRCSIVLLDVDQLGDKLGARLAELERLERPPVAVAAGSSEAAPEMMRAHSERRIHRLLVKPASPGKLQLLLTAAIKRNQQPREPIDQPTPFGPSYGAQRGDAGKQRLRRRSLLLVAGMVIVFAAVVSAGLMWRAPDETAPLAAPVPAPTPAPSTAPVIRPVAAPRNEPVVEPGRVVAPAGPEVEPVAAPAIEPLFTLVESALLNNDLETAATTLDEVRRIEPGHTRLAFLDVQLERARAERVVAEERAAQERAAQERAAQERAAQERAAQERAAQERAAQERAAQERAAAEAAAAASVASPAPARAQATPPARVEAEPPVDQIGLAQAALDAGDLGTAEELIAAARELGMDEAVLAELEWRLGSLRETLREERQGLLLALGLERLRDGQLTVPETDSAVHHLARLQAENPAYPGLSDAVAELTTKLVANVLASTARTEWGATEAGLAGLASIGADSRIVAPLAEDVAESRRRDRFLRVPASGDELELIRSRAPIYPQAAVRNEIEGWVELEFIVDRDGVPRDITIVDEQPAAVFGRAATDAVERYRYAPFVLDDVVYERRVKMRMLFKFGQ
jgi:TonB family protein